MKKTTGQLLTAARQILADAAVLAPQHADALGRMKLRISNRMTRCAGTASYNKNEITLSLPYFSDQSNFDNELRDTITHEAAHLLVGRAGRGSRPHGPMFVMIDKQLGGTGNRTHSMKLGDGYKRRDRKPRTAVQCPCGCNTTMKLGPTQLKRHAKGERYYIKGHQPKRQRFLSGVDLPELDSFFS